MNLDFEEKYINLWLELIRRITIVLTRKMAVALLTADGLSSHRHMLLIPKLFVFVIFINKPKGLYSMVGEFCDQGA